AEQQVEAHHQDREDQRAGREQDEERRGERDDDRQRRDRGDHDCDLETARRHDAHSRPNRPVGLTARITAIGAYSVKYETSGNSALPKLSASPTRSAPIAAPPRLPMPPMITTAKASGRISKSSPG